MNYVMNGITLKQLGFIGMVVLAVPTLVLGQGGVNFNTLYTPNPMSGLPGCTNPVHRGSLTGPLVDNHYYATLLGNLADLAVGMSEEGKGNLVPFLKPAGTNVLNTFRTSGFAGHLAGGGTVLAPNATWVAGTEMKVEVVVWSADLGSDWSAAYDLWRTGVGEMGWSELLALKLSEPSSPFVVRLANNPELGPDQLGATPGLGTIVVAAWAPLGDRPPSIDRQPQDLTLWPGDSNVLAVVTTGSLPRWYQWYKGLNPSNAIVNATNAIYPIPSARLADADYYTLVVANAFGEASSRSALVTVLANGLAITTPPTNLSVPYGSAVSFTTVATGAPPVFYQWSKEGAPLLTATNGTYSISSTAEGDAGTYTVLASNRLGTASASATLTLFDTPLAITNQPLAQTALAGDNVTFAVGVGGTRPRYQWYFQGTAVPGATNPALTLTGVTTGQAGPYQVVVANPLGSVTSLVATLAISQTQFVAINEHLAGAATHPNATLYSVKPPSATNSGQLRNLTDGAATPVILTVTNRPSISYGGLSAVPDAGTPAAQVFGAFVTFGNGYLQLGATQVVAHVLTGLDPARLYSLKGTAIRSGYADRWTLFELAEAVSFTSAHSAGCLTNGRPGISLADNQVALCTGENRAGDLFDWEDVQPGPSGTVVIYSKRFLGASVSGVFSNSPSMPCYALEALRVAELASGRCSPPRFSVQPQNVAAWPGESVGFSVAGGGSYPLFYQWFRDLEASTPIPNATNAVYSLAGATPADAGSYWVQVTNECGLTNSRVATLTLLTNPPVITQVPTNLSVPIGSAASFSAVVASAPPLFYQWSKDGAPIRTATNSTYSISRTVDGDAGTYTLLASNPVGTASASASLTLFDTPLVITNQPLDQAALAGSNATFAVGVGGTRPLYQWYFQGTTVPGATNPALTLTGVTTGQAGAYQVVVINPLGSVTSAVATLVLLRPAAPDLFNPGANGAVWCLGAQTDGKILVGGGFTNLGGQACSRLGRLNPDGALDTAFNPGADNSIYCLAVLETGNILVAGAFTSLGGRPCSRLGRLYADGTPDTAFAPGADGTVQSLVVQADGKLVVGGAFVNLGGQGRTRLGRLNADGTLDGTFNVWADGTVYSLALQTDGRILVGGAFTNLASQLHSRLGRLTPQGTLDTSFTASANGTVWCIAVQADGKILVGGDFTSLNGVARNYMGRLNADGTLDTSFTPAAAPPSVTSLALQTDGNILVTGGFTTLAGQTRSHLGRLHPDGTLDPAFNPGADGPVWSALVQPDGKVLVGGQFATLGGLPRANVGRLSETSPATESLTLLGDTLTWRRGGAGPEVWRTISEVSTNGGASWQQSEAGTRLPGGWQISGVHGLAGGVFRVRGYVAGGYGSASSWSLETWGGAPAILTQPQDVRTNFGAQLVFSVQARGLAPLNYQWQQDGADLVESPRVSGTRTARLVISQAQPGDAGTYSVMVSNTYGLVSRVVVNLTLADPLITAQPASQTVLLGADVSFFVGAAGTAPLSYQWFKGGILLPGATRDALNLTHVQWSDDGSQYTVAVHNSSGSVTSAPAVLTVISPPVPDAFNPGANGTVWSLAVQPDGKVLVGGDFTSLGGQARKYLGRLNSDGSLDGPFQPAVNQASVLSLVVQPDGKILLGGGFTSLGTSSRNRIARLNADGTLDGTFAAGADNTVRVLLVQPDGKILVGGSFMTLAGQPRGCLGRLNADGSLDPSFNPGADALVCSLAVQPNGQIQVGGNFATLGGQPRTRLGRLNADGSLDATFNPVTDGVISCLALQADGKVLVAGCFTVLNGSACTSLGRLNPDGSTDTNYTPKVQFASDVPLVRCLAPQADGKVLVAGRFDTLGGQPHNHLGRLNPEGSVDGTFTPGADESVYALAIQTDGKVLVGGAFLHLSDQSRAFLGRLNNTAEATQRLVLEDSNATWLCRGTSPEFCRTTFALSTNGGAEWLPLGPGVRRPGGWQMDGLSGGASLTVRAQGFLSGGFGNASSWSIETFVGAPAILTELSPVLTNAGADLVFTVAPVGTAPLSYRWQKDGIDLTDTARLVGSGTGTLVLSNAQPADAGVYSVIMNNAYGSSSRPIVHLTLADPLITVQPASQMAQLGTNLLLSVSAVGSSPLSYQWYWGDTLIPGATTSSLLVSNLSWPEQGNQFFYGVVVSNSAGSVTSATAIVTVSSAPTPDPLDPAADGTVWCLAVQPDGRILLGGDFTTLGGLARSYLGRLNADGSVDTAFNPGATPPSVLSLAVQPDGRILVGGNFTGLGGQYRNRIGRLLPDGTPELSFNPGADGGIQTIVLQPDGKILLGGFFATLAGQPRGRIGRLLEDGNLDPGFNSTANGAINTLAVQPDGKILVGGAFTTLAGQPRTCLGRLLPDGSLDSSFNPGTDGNVHCLALQADGRILVGGAFTSLGGQSRSRLGRLHPDGTLDAGFTTGADNGVYSLAIQTDGQVVVGGDFTTLGGVPRSRLGRLSADGMTDGTFAPAVAGTVCALALQADGRTLVGGNFTALGGQARNRLARLTSTSPARQSFTLNGATATWLRQGTAPEVWRTVFELTTNGGVSWVSPVAGGRIPGGWQLDGVPAEATVRARGFVTGGYANGSGWFVEALAGLAYCTNQPRNIVTNAGASLVWAITAVSASPVSYQWQKDGLDLTDGGRFLGTRTSALLLSNALTSDSGTYSLVVSNAAGLLRRPVAGLTVLDPFLTSQPLDQSSLVGTAATFTVGAVGTAPLHYQWLRNGVPISDATAALLTVSDVQATYDGAAFRAVVSNVSGSVTSAVARLTVLHPVALDEFAPAADATVYALARQSDGKLVVGGSFLTLAGQLRSRLGRLNPDGSVDPTFHLGTDGPVYAVALQPDGRILVGGQFSVLGGRVCRQMGRFNPDGSLDAAFAPGADGTVQSLAVQPDGKILVGGTFTALAGQNRSRLGRLNADGTLDSTFTPAPDGTVYCLALQPDGRILVGGEFINLAGQNRARFGRLNPDGTLDTTFAPAADNKVLSVALQADGQILLSGTFLNLAGQSRRYLGRVRSDGSLDAGFNPGASGGVVTCFALQTDGKILAGGAFATLGGAARSRIGRLNPDGSLDSAFNPGSDGPVHALALLPDGRLVAGGDFALLGGQARSRLARLTNTAAATERLDWNGSNLVWQRGGTSPEVWRTMVEVSTNGGGSWTSLGAGTRLAGSWTFDGLAELSGVALRVRGAVAGGYQNASGWFADSYLGAPVVLTVPGELVTSPGSRLVLTVESYGSAPLTYQWRRNGADLAENGRVAGVTSTELVITNLLATDVGVYSVMVRNAFGAVDGRITSVSLADPVFTSQPISQVVSLGTNVTFSVTVIGTAPLCYQWFNRGVAVPNATLPALTLTNVQWTDDGSQFCVVVSNAFGTLTSAVVSLSLVTPSVVDPFNAGLGGTVWCLALQPDGKIVLGGDFPSLGGQARSFLGRVNADGSLDPGFDPGASPASVISLALQPDGQILVGGAFTTLAGQSCNRIGRLNPDGSLNSAFGPGADNRVWSVLLQPDGRILVAGEFGTLGGQPRARLGRLLPEGSLDSGFNPGADGMVHALALQPDGRILVGGAFATLGGQARSRLGRLNPDGSADPSFNPGASGVVRCLLLQPDGSILVGGDFTTLGGQPCARLGRLRPDGSLDDSFVAGADDTVCSLLLQTDGKVLAGGAFTTLAGLTRNRLGRLNPDGTLDESFSLGANSLVCALAMQVDGRVLVGGNFTSLGGQSRYCLGRLGNTVLARQSLIWDETGLTWWRSGASPEFWRTILECSADGGLSWRTLATGARVPGGWTWSGLAAPAHSTLRARGFMTGGNDNASGGLVEAFAGLPYFTNQVQQVLTNATAQVLFSLTALGGTPLSYQWQKDGVDLPATGRFIGPHSNVLIITSVQGGDTGMYSLVASNLHGIVTRQVASLTVVDPLITSQPTDQEVFVGQDAVFTFAAAGTAPLAYQWCKAGIPLPGRTASSLTVTNVQASDEGGQYTVLVSNEFGSLTSAVARLTVLTPVVPDTFSAVADSTVYALAVQTDRKILVGGEFQMLGGQPRSRVGRLKADGTLDPAFDPSADNVVHAVTLQPDGRILVAGQFTTLAGQTRLRLGRLQPDGSLDGTFNPGADGTLQCLVLQADGKILVGGSFTTLAGQPRNRIGRLNPDGSLDTTFNPGASATVYALAIQPDGKILAGGTFTTVGGQTRNRIARLNPDGSLDSRFVAEPNGTVWTLAVQPDGAILAGGDFTSLGSESRGYLGRFHPNGTLDTGFNPAANCPSVTSFALQTDGKILVGGSFTSLGGQRRNYLARLKPDGSLDSSFNPECSASVYSLTVQPDGKVLVGGVFTSLGGQPRSRLGRLNNTLPASQELAWTETGVTWWRSGSSPEVWRTTFEITTNGGSSWASLGTGTRVAGGWQFTGLAPTVNATLRVRGFVTGGCFDGSGWFVEAATGRPQIATLPQTCLTHAGATLVLAVDASGSAPLLWQWRKDGLALPEGDRFSGTQGSVLSISNIQVADAGAYSVVIGNSLGQATGLIASVLVADPLITAQPSSQTAWTGSNVVLTVSAAGTAPLAYQWYEGAVPLPGATAATLTFSNVRSADDGRQFSAVVSNPAGSATSAVASLTILSPAFPDSFAPGADASVYALAVQPDGGVLVGGDFAVLGNQSRMRLARLDAEGNVDSSWSLGADNSVLALALQPDGKVLVAGQFLTLGGQTRSRLARLNGDGTLEAAFNPGANAAVRCLALQADGKILVGGAFTALAGQPRAQLGRLNADGSLDSSFNPGAGSTVYCLAIQPDGKILVGGAFTTLAGQSRNRLGRLNADGTLDTAFLADVNGTVWSMAVQADGQILAGGDFTLLGGQARNYVGRLRANGTTDPAFTPSANGASVTCFALQADGKILVGGQFTVLAGLTRNRLARLHADGTVDSTFDPGSDGPVHALTLQADGKVLVGGAFSVLGGQSRLRFGRLNNTTPARVSLTWGETDLTWLRGGASPEVWRTTFEISTNQGASWVPRGWGVRIPGGWSFSAIPPLAGASGRARGFLAGGYANASGWFVETRAGAPSLPSQPLNLWTNPGVVLTLAARADGSDPRSYRWLKDGISLPEGGRFFGTESSVLRIVATEVGDSGAYSVLVSNSLGVASGAVVHLTVADPLIARQPASQVAWLGTNLMLTVDALGTAPLTYQWFSADLPIPGATTAALTVSNVSWGDDGRSYHVVVRGPAGSVTSAVAMVTVAASPMPDALNPNVNGSVLALAVQADGKILLGGDFTSLGSIARRYLARLNADGSLDGNFKADADAPSLLSLTVQTDGRILVGGGFSTLGGQARNRLARLEPDGAVDPSFNPGVNEGHVRVLLQLSSGKILVGGDFTVLAGQSCSRLGRLNPDGSFDATFNPGADGPVYSLALQPDGKLLVGGGFTTLAGQARNRLGRLNSNGSLDTTFNPGADGLVRCLVVQPDTRILVGGDFTVCAGQERGRLARLRPEGSLDGTFTTAADDSVYSIVLQADGRILVGGAFSLLGGQTRRSLGRLLPDGRPDDLFNPGANAIVCALGLQADGSILVGGSFWTVGGLARNRIARLNNTSPAFQDLALSTTDLTWRRGGTAPELWGAQLEASTNSGTSWSNLGPGVRIPGGWQWAGAMVPPNASLRARGFVTGGHASASHWLVEGAAGLPYATNQVRSVLTNAEAIVVFTIEAVSGSSLTYQWQLNGSDLSAHPRFVGLHSNVLVINSLKAADAGLYSVVLSNASGTVTRPVADLTVVDPLITGQPLSQIAWLGTNLGLSVSAAGTPPLTYQWYRDGTLVPEATAASLTIPNVTWADDASSYRVVVRNSSGSVTSAVAVLSVFASPVPDAFLADANSTVWSLAVQPDGKTLVGGDFTSLAGQTRRYLGRLNPDGTLDTAFDPSPNQASVLSLTVQADGKILVGGGFTTLAGLSCNSFGRLNGDGRLDAGFNPNANGAVRCALVQADGHILVGGDFTSLGGWLRNRIGRLHPDGTVDTSFSPGADGPVYALAMQPDGKILVAGSFAALALQARSCLGRLNADGTVDGSFNPGANGTVRCLAVQADAKILVGGDFSTLGGQSRGYLARLNPDGSLDASFTAGADAPSVVSLALQADGKILVAGGFQTLGGRARSRLGRLNPDGSVDEVFAPGANNAVYALGLQADGSVLVGGAFGVLGGQTRLRLGRLNNTVPASQSMQCDGSSLTWLRGGASPELWRTTFELSTNQGASWTDLGAGTRVLDRWELGGLAVPPTATVRARGFLTGGSDNASGWFVETLTGPPHLVVQPWNLLTNARAVVVLTAVSDSTSPLTCQWQKDGVDVIEGPNLVGARSPVLTLKNVQASDSGAYSVSVASYFGQASVLVANLIVAELLITSQPASQFAWIGSNAVFQVGAGGTLPITYQWFRAGLVLPGATFPTLVLTNLQWTDDGAEFHVLVSNTVGTATSAVARLTVLRPPLPDTLVADANLSVHALAVQPDGAILVGGDFTTLGGQPRQHLGRLSAEGATDLTFSSGTDGSVYALAVQHDGAILVAGFFSTLAGQPRASLGRLGPDGTLDLAFNPRANAPIRCLALQPDGKILVGGSFGVLAGQTCARLGRLNADGTLDPSFHPSPNGTIYSIALQPDGAILVGGSFSTLGGGACSRLGRLNPDGTVDASFAADANGTVWCLAVQPDGKILAGGDFTALDGQVRSYLGRVNSDGTLDSPFNPWVNSPTLSCFALQTDGKILVGGPFTVLDGRTRRALGRLNADGSLDDTFDPGCDGIVYALTVQADGKVLVGGAFGTLGGQARSRLGRLHNTTLASQSLTRSGPNLLWLRGGASPEVWRTTFELSTDAGATWESLGYGTRGPGGWQIPAGSVPPTACVRARGFVVGGADNASGWFVETILPPARPPRFDTGLALQLSGGQFHLRLQDLPALPGRVVLEASSDLRAGWTPILTNSTPLDVLDYTEPADLRQSQRFYRALWQQP